MLCANCGTANPDGGQFCTSCGKPLHTVWQSPQSELVAGAAIDGEELVYAGFWARFAAWIVDFVVLWIVTVAITLVTGGAIALTYGGNASFTSNTLPWVMSAAYFVLMESSASGATLGKRALRLRVVDVAGNRISKLRGLGRWVAHALSDITLFIGYLIQPFTGRKQALHDMVSGTLVIKTDKSSGGLAIVVSIVGAFLALVIGIGVFAAIAVPKFESYLSKSKTMQLMQADMVGRMAAKAVQDYAAKTGKVPASIDETGFQLPKSPIRSAVAGIKVDPSGEVRVVFSGQAGAKLAGKALLFDPSRNAKGKIDWKCSGPGIPAEMLPPDCK